METWVLYLALYGSGRAIAVVPGYESKVACERAAEQIPRYKWGSANPDTVFCFPGPMRQR